MRFFALFLGLLATLMAAPAAGPVADERGLIGLQLLLRKLAMAGTVMHVTAHPDDENNALMARQAHGLGLRVILATATRGNGGQNEIGPELFEALGVLRTEELLAAHRYDGAEQLFARAVDFGYSFSVEETFRRWGKDEILGDYVRLIRMTRPDVMITMRPDLPGGGQHHQASALIGLDAFRAAGDPARYPEQVDAGLRPWQPAKIYKVGYYGFFRGEPEPPAGTRLVPMDAEVYDPLLGRTYQEIGSEARAMHKCQGFGQLLALPGSRLVKYQLADTTIPGQQDRDERDLTDGLDLSLRGLARFAGASPPDELVEALDAVARAVETAGAQARQEGPAAATGPLLEGLTRTRALGRWLGSTAAVDASGRFEIAFRLARTEALFEQAVILANAIRVETLADDGVVTRGQPVNVQLIVANRGKGPVTIAELSPGGTGPGCAAGVLAAGAVQTCASAITVPESARTSEPYWRRDGEADRYVFARDAPFGAPFAPSPFRARVSFAFGTHGRVSLEQPLQHRYEGSIFSGEKRADLLVVPVLSVRVSPEIAVVPVGVGPKRTAERAAQDAAREMTVTVTNNAPQPAKAFVSLSLPAGWRAQPESRAISLSRADEAATTTFVVYPPPGLAPGAYTVAARVTTGETTWSRGFDVIEYPHTTRQHIYTPAETTIKALEVQLPPGLAVGYVMGVGDQVPPAIAQLGASVRLLGEQDLASGDLSKFDAIVTGVRAYERRKDLRAFNHRLIEYARAGGTVLVQYNKFEFNQAQYGPWPARVSANRVTDEASPVTVLVPGHPAFTTPNPLGDDTWAGWVQERGLYFLGERDPQYVDLVELRDPFADNAGPKRGALVEARIGSGRWIYIGLGLWRQLPAGTSGAYRLLANLLSLKATGAAP
jgi:LmbE family N-acetylglucosaminyl deacetylase